MIYNILHIIQVTDVLYIYFYLTGVDVKVCYIYVTSTYLSHANIIFHQSQKILSKFKDKSVKKSS